MEWLPVPAVPFLLCLSLAAEVAAGGEPVTALFGVEDPPPAILSALGPAAELQVVAVTPDATRAAAALASRDKQARAVVRIVESGSAATTDLRMSGRVRSLAFGADGAVLYALLHRGAKHREGDSHLVRIEVDTLKARREMRLPATASAMVVALDGTALLVASRDEVRTVLLPDLRSGRLFRVPGDNLSLAAQARGTRILLGQPERIVAVDLADPPGPDHMPLRGEVATRAPITGLALAKDARGGLARTAEGEVFRFWLDPLRLAPQPPPSAAPPPAGDPERIVGDESGAAPERAPEGSPTPRPSEVPPTAPAPTPAPEPAPERAPRTATPRPGPSPEPAAPPAAGAPAPGAPDPAPRPAPAAEPRPQIRGKVEGPAAAAVREVLLLGPDTLLREAARVKPRPDGTWSLSGLAPGRYRVQLDAGGSRVLITDPPFRTVLLEPSATVEVEPIRVLRAL